MNPTTTLTKYWTFGLNQTIRDKRVTKLFELKISFKVYYYFNLYAGSDFKWLTVINKRGRKRDIHAIRGFVTSHLTFVDK